MLQRLLFFVLTNIILRLVLQRFHIINDIQKVLPNY